MTIGRRGFLAAAVLLPGYGSRVQRRSGYPFTLGVASGDPLPDGVVLWTRLAPSPLVADPATPGGMPPLDVSVDWEVATDDRFANVVRRGGAIARPGLAHAVHVEVSGLLPGHEYFYRFRTGGEISPVGRTRTAAGPYAPKVRFAFTSCQHYEDGFFTVHRHMAEEDLDLVVQLGDYIYEMSSKAPPSGKVRHHGTPEAVDLPTYRLMHTVYKLDPDLQASHAMHPWLVTWDDHEVFNNYSGDLSVQEGPATFLRRRTAAYQAYYEHMPLRRSSAPRGPDMRIYRRRRYGRLVELSVLDTRQYRVSRPAGYTPDDPADREDPARDMLGAEQEEWLLSGLDASTARWQVIAQQVFFAGRNIALGDGQRYNMDAWDGFPLARTRLLRGMTDRGIRNPVVITGDVHASWAADLKARWSDPDSATLGVELVGTSATSGGDGSEIRADTATILAKNPHIKFFNGLRGYVRCTATPSTFQADYRVVPFVSVTDAPIHTRASFRVQDGHPGLEKIADAPIPAARYMSPETVYDGIEG